MSCCSSVLCSVSLKLLSSQGTCFPSLRVWRGTEGKQMFPQEASQVPGLKVRIPELLLEKYLVVRVLSWPQLCVMIPLWTAVILYQVGQFKCPVWRVCQELFIMTAPGMSKCSCMVEVGSFVLGNMKWHPCAALVRWQLLMGVSNKKHVLTSVVQYFLLWCALTDLSSWWWFHYRAQTWRGLNAEQLLASF